ncbi:MAG: hypothetical protein AB1584_22755 [Pseudomonadota bacterium]
MKKRELLVPNAVLRYALILAFLLACGFAGSLAGGELGKVLYHLTH